MEVSVPIIIKSMYTNNCIIGPIQFQNIIVPDCPPYDVDGSSYKRTIQRTSIPCDATWPPHPTNNHGRILGAIILIRSSDDMYLLVRNGNLWGLPKGARNYPAFLQCKEVTDKHYINTGMVYVHDRLVLDSPEGSIENAIRETLEETGIIVDIKYLASFKPDDSHYTAYDRYIYDYPHTAGDYLSAFSRSRHRIDSENDALMWVTKEELQDMIRDQLWQKRIFNQVSTRFLQDYLG